MTLNPGKLIVASAYPDPPFDLIDHGSPGGFDIELMRAISAQLSLTLQPVRYAGDDFNGIFDGLAKRSYDAVISGTTITPERAAIALFSQAYLEFNQGIAINRERTPGVASTADLRGLTAGIQSGNTSDLVAGRLLAEGADVVVWDPIAHADGFHGVEQVPSVADAARDADAVVLVTEWPELADVEWGAVGSTMRSQVFVDGRNMLDPDAMRAAGFRYAAIGRASNGTV